MALWSHLKAVWKAVRFKSYYRRRRPARWLRFQQRLPLRLLGDFWSQLKSHARATSSQHAPVRLRLEPLEARVVPSADRFDLIAANETLGTASNVGVAPGIHLDNLTIDAGDSDWYKIELLRGDSLDFHLTFTHGAGQELSLEVTNAAGTPLGTGSSTGSGLSLTLNSLAAGTYYVHASGVSGTDANTYSL